MEDDKVTIRLQLVGATPAINPRVVKVARSVTVATIIQFVTKRLRLESPPFLYLHSAFQIRRDEVVGELFDCYRTGEELIISYCTTEAFG